MPTPYRYFSCADLPAMEIGDVIGTEVQAGFDYADDKPGSWLRYLGPSEHSDFESYEAVHQVIRDVDAVWNHQHVSSLIFNERFRVFYNRAKGYFAAQTNKKSSRGFFLAMAQSRPAITATPGRLDLTQVQQLGLTTGGWFADLKITDVRTAGIFGTSDIVDSDDWGRYAAVGQISALIMQVASRSGAVRSVEVTRDRLVLIMQNQAEQDHLDFVEHLNSIFDDLPGSS